MSQADSRTRSISWLAVVNQGLFLLILLFLFHRVAGSMLAALIAVILLMVWLRWMRTLLLAPYRRGFRLVHEQKFADAAVAFDQGHRFFARFWWLDMFRTFLLLSPSRMGYRELGLTNLGYAYIRAGERDKAQSTYEQLQREFPHSRAAKMALDRLAKGWPEAGLRDEPQTEAPIDEPR